MNWLKQIRQVLGRFWGALIAPESDDFIRGVESASALAAGSEQRMLDRWRAGMVAGDSSSYNDPLPFVIYLKKTSVVEVDADSSDGTVQYDYVSDIGHPAVSLDAILAGYGELGEEDSDAGWVCSSPYEFPVPFCISDHAVSYNKVLYRDIDYSWDGANLVLYADPATLGFDSVAMTDDKGLLHTYYRVFGWTEPELAIKDMVAGFESEELATDAAQAAWDMHQRGATWLNVKKLLAAVTGAVVCDSEGVVTDCWKEQGRTCVLVDNKHVYYNTEADDASESSYHGKDVDVGDILFGDFRMISGADLSDSDADFPGMSVQTDVGELKAMNSVSQTYVGQSGLRVLPLSCSDASRLSAYRQQCERNVLEKGCAEIALPESVNPMYFICSRLRKGKTALINIKAAPGNHRRIAAALECIRKNACASSMILVNIEAKAATLETGVSAFTASAGHAAVAVCASLELAELFTKAKASI